MAVVIPLSAWKLTVWGFPVFAIAGLVVGSVIAASVGPHVAAETALRFVRTVAPLGLVVYAILVFGSRSLPIVAQLALGAAILAVVALVRRSESALDEGGFPAVGHISFALARRVAIALAVAVGAVFAVIFLAVWIPPAWDRVWPILDGFDELGGVATVIAVVAALTWLAALSLRLFSFADSALRAAVAAATGAAALYALVLVGLLPGYALAADIRSFRHAWWLLVAIGAVAATVELLLRRMRRAAGGERPPSSTGRSRLAALRLGYAASWASAAMIVVAMTWGLFSANIGSQRLVDERGVPFKPGQSPVAPATMGDQQLAETFVPILFFTEDEAWAPIAVDDYLSDARLEAGGETVAHGLTLGTLPRTCPAGSAPPCFTLTLDCEEASEACSQRTAEHEPGYHLEGAVYVRVLRKATDGRLFAESTPFGDQVSVVVQYWYFYAYDEWKTWSLVGRLRQWHEADWEAITIGLSDTGPLFVGYSAHCGGRWYDWDDVEVIVANKTADGWTHGRRNSHEPARHPLVAVAEGSHANYVRSFHGRSPDWAGCRNVSGDAVAALSYASNLRDRTEDGWGVIPSEIVVVDETTPPMTFPGRWGRYDRTVLENFRERELASGHGPATPTLQPLWTNPLRTVFASSNWRHAS